MECPECKSRKCVRYQQRCYKLYGGFRCVECGRQWSIREETEIRLPCEHKHAYIGFKGSTPMIWCPECKSENELSAEDFNYFYNTFRQKVFIEGLDGD